LEADLEAIPERIDLVAEFREREKEREGSSKESTPQRTFGRKRKKTVANDNMSSAASTCSEDSISERGSDAGGTSTIHVLTKLYCTEFGFRPCRKCS
jgi:hypothetical protein